MRLWLLALCLLTACDCDSNDRQLGRGGDAAAGDSGAFGPGHDRDAEGQGGSSWRADSSAGGNSGGDGSSGAGGGAGTGGGFTDNNGGRDVPPPNCDYYANSDVRDLPENYGYASVPPMMALADTFYTYDLRTNIGACSTDRVSWTFEQGPPDARIELPGVSNTLVPGDTFVHEDGGDARERVKVSWSLEGEEAGCVVFKVRWKAWRDCGIGDDGSWGPELTQEWSIAVRRNHWYSGDMHVHTKHSERGEEAGSTWDYVRRMRNEATNDAGDSFASRRFRSLRGRLHWVIFSEHTNNEMEECGRHFAAYCIDDAALDVATGRDVAREYTEMLDGEVLLVGGSEISNKYDGHFGFLPRNPFPGHPIYAPGYFDNPTDYDLDVGYGAGTMRERWIDGAATNTEEIAQIRDMGGLAIVNHETAAAFWIRFDWTTTDIDGLEVWNGGNRHDKYDDSAYNGEVDLNDITEDNLLDAEIPEDPIEHSWLGLLKTGRWPLALVGGSDTHDYNEVVCFDGPCDPTNAEFAVPTTSVWAPHFVWADGRDGVGDALAAGRAVVHDQSNFIDLRITHSGHEYGIGDTIEGYSEGQTLDLRAFGRVANFVDGDNRVLLILGTRIDAGDRQVDVLYSSEDEEHFVQSLQSKDHMRYIRADSSFDRAWSAQPQMGDSDYLIWAQFVPWHNPAYLVGNGQDMALTGAIRIRR